jgi:hypothetical protein
MLDDLADTETLLSSMYSYCLLARYLAQEPAQFNGHNLLLRLTIGSASR